MRDGDSAARAVLRSEMYRADHRNVGAVPLGVAGVPPRPRAKNGAGAPGPRRGSIPKPPLSVLALLGLLDLFEGG